MKENISQLVQRNQELQDRNKDLTDKLATVVNTMTDLKGLCEFDSIGKHSQGHTRSACTELCCVPSLMVNLPSEPRWRSGHRPSQMC